MTNKEAIEHLTELKTLKIEFPNTLQEQALDLAIKALEERPKGEWIKDNSGNRFCSECGSSALYHEIGLIIESRFCPNCGAKMKD